MSPIQQLFLGTGAGGATSYWITSMGGSGTLDRWYDCSIDSSDNIFVSGNTTSNVTGYAGLVAKFDTDGAVVWQRDLDDTTNSGNQLFVGGGIAGTTTGNASEMVYHFGNSGYNNIGGLGARYLNDGTIQNNFRLNDSQTDNMYPDGVDVFGPANTSGNTQSAYTRVAITGHMAYGSGAYRGFLFVRNNSFQVIEDVAFQHPSSSGTTTEFKRVLFDTSSATDANGTGAKIIVTGFRGGGITTNSNNLWIASLTTGSGTGIQSPLAVSWQKEITASPFGSPADMALDSSGNIYLCGFVYDWSVGPVPQIYKLNSSGVIQWQKKISGWSYARCITPDSSGNVYIGGQYSNNAWLMKLDSSGSTVWQREIDGIKSGAQNQEVIFRAIKLNSKGDIILSGWTGVTDAGGNKNTFLMKYPSDGSITGTFGGVWVISSLSDTVSNTSFGITASNLSKNSPTITDTDSNALTDAATSFTPSLTTIS